MKNNTRKATKKGTGKGTRKGSATTATPEFSQRTGRAVTTTTKFDSGDAEPIADAAGEIGNAAHALFFNSPNLPPFLRNSIEQKIKQAAARLNMPDSYDTDDDRPAFQQTVDLFIAAGDELFLPSSPLEDSGLMYQSEIYEHLRGDRQKIAALVR